MMAKTERGMWQRTILSYICIWIINNAHTQNKIIWNKIKQKHRERAWEEQKKPFVVCYATSGKYMQNIEFMKILIKPLQ